MSQSIPYQVSAAVVAALKTALEPGASVVDNPTSAGALSQGDRVVFVEDTEDDLFNRPGQAEGRTFAFIVGVINRTVTGRAGADEEAQGLKPVVTRAARDCCKSLQDARSIGTFNLPRETKRTYRHEHIDVDGALILTRFEIDYRLPAAKPAG